MVDFLVQLAVGGVAFALLLLLIVTQERRANLRERLLHSSAHRHWWNRPRNGH